eukprot:1580859-Alexandrium_andersonii.AAC.1
MSSQGMSRSLQGVRRPQAAARQAHQALCKAPAAVAAQVRTGQAPPPQAPRRPLPPGSGRRFS